MVLTPFVSETVWGGRRLIDEYSVVTDKRNAAEAWVMSAHKNGSSTVANGEFAGKSLREVYLEHPELGGKNCAGFSDFPVLIKFIDAAADLSVQVHPDDAYCLKKGSGAGKTESWYILDCEPGAYLLLGFEKDITREQFRQSITDGTLTDYVKKVPVKKGDFFFIESGTLHAICKGILLAEVQQNSDTTYRIYDYGRLGFDGKPRELHGAVDLALALLSQIGLHGLEQVAVGGVVPAAAQRRHHPAQLPYIDVELRLRRGRRRLLAAAVAQD